MTAAFDNDSTHGRPTASTPTTPSRRPWRTWWLHVAEMMIAMIAGMVVLGGALEGTLSLAGTSLSDAPAAIKASVMAFNMTVPMAAWMHYRGHGVRHSVEMAGSMIVPTALVIALHSLGLVAAGAVLLIQHVVMVPAMVGVMLVRFEHYAH